MPQSPTIRVGVGGWTFEPWRDNFYPKGLPHTKELGFASRHLTAIEINGTYYGSQKPASFAKWHDETPDDFVFALKASRFSTNRKVLADGGESVRRFINSGIAELRGKLGPINWQFLPTKKFDPADFAAFLALLPKEVAGLPLRHVVEVRHESFAVPQFIDLLRQHGVAAVLTDNPEFPRLHDATADFVYARLQCAREEEPAGYAPAALDGWAKTAKAWAKGQSPKALPLLAPAMKAAGRDVFVFFISGFKQRNPAAAMALMDRL
jgi:uncharacterized protein YecE (DUF72 family)